MAYFVTSTVEWATFFIVIPNRTGLCALLSIPLLLNYYSFKYSMKKSIVLVNNIGGCDYEK